MQIRNRYLPLIVVVKGYCWTNIDEAYLAVVLELVSYSVLQSEQADAK